MGRGRRGARAEQAQQCVIRATIDGCKMSVRDWESFMRVVQAERVRNVGVAMRGVVQLVAYGGVVELLSRLPGMS